MTSYTNIFGGNPILPADMSYRLIELDADQALLWTTAFQDSTKFVAHIMDVDVKEAGKSLFLPDATLVSVGTSFIFSNVSALAFRLANFTGDTLAAEITQGQTYYYYLTDNTTQDGSWRAIPLGAGSVIPGIMSVAAEAEGTGLTITGSPVTPPGGVIKFDLDQEIQNMLIAARKLGKNVGFLVREPSGDYAFRELQAGEGITIDLPDGDGANPTISVDMSDFPGLKEIDTLSTTPQALPITPAKINADNTTLTVGLHPSLDTLYNLGVASGPTTNGFVVRSSFNAPYYTTRKLVAGTGISIVNPDGANGDITINCTVPTPPTPPAAIQSLQVTSVADYALRVSGSPTTGTNPTITLDLSVPLFSIFENLDGSSFGQWRGFNIGRVVVGGAGAPTPYTLRITFKGGYNPAQYNRYWLVNPGALYSYHFRGDPTYPSGYPKDCDLIIPLNGQSGNKFILYYYPETS